MPAPRPPEFRRRAVELARRRKKPVAQTARTWGSPNHACTTRWPGPASAGAGPRARWVRDGDDPADGSRERPSRRGGGLAHAGNEDDPAGPAQVRKVLRPIAHFLSNGTMAGSRGGHGPCACRRGEHGPGRVLRLRAAAVRGTGAAEPAPFRSSRSKIVGTGQPRVDEVGGRPRPDPPVGACRAAGRIQIPRPPAGPATLLC